MINKSKTTTQVPLLNQLNSRDPEHIEKQLECLIEEGKNIDINDFKSLYDWVNSTFTHLEPFLSEHLSFRLHCLHTGLTLLSIALEKENWLTGEASIAVTHAPIASEQ